LLGDWEECFRGSSENLGQRTSPSNSSRPRSSSDFEAPMMTPLANSLNSPSVSFSTINEHKSAKSMQHVPIANLTPIFLLAIDANGPLSLLQGTPSPPRSPRPQVRVSRAEEAMPGSWRTTPHGGPTCHSQRSKECSCLNRSLRQFRPRREASPEAAGHRKDHGVVLDEEEVG
jgi:hypothetical protein